MALRAEEKHAAEIFNKWLRNFGLAAAPASGSDRMWLIFGDERMEIWCADLIPAAMLLCGLRLGGEPLMCTNLLSRWRFARICQDGPRLYSVVLETMI